MHNMQVQPFSAAATEVINNNTFQKGDCKKTFLFYLLKTNVKMPLMFLKKIKS